MALALMVPGTAAAEPTSGPPGDISNPAADDCVEKSKIVSIQAMLPDGTLVPAKQNDGHARAHTETLGPDTLMQVTPPPGWTPVDATDQELFSYRFPARPTDPAQLKAWQERWSHWKRAAAPGMCTTSVINADFYKTNWAGGMNWNGTHTINDYYSTTAEWVEPAFVGVCPGASGYSMWAGLGGFHSNGGQYRLIQAGVAVSQDSTSSPGYAWWEMISTEHWNYEVKFDDPDNFIYAGDLVNANALYIDGYGAADMGVYDVTTGTSFDTGLVFTRDGVPANTYWDGTTSEWISESPMNGATMMYLRKPTAGASGWASSTTNFLDRSDYPTYSIEQFSGSSFLQTTSFVNSGAWGNGWIACS